MDMNDRPKQDLAEAFAGIITMMLRTIRARGWRSLRNLPEIWRESVVIYGYGVAFAALVADWRAGKLAAPVPMPPPEPMPWSDAPEREVLRAQSPTPHCPAARPEPAARVRQQVARRRSLPAADAGPDRPCAMDRVRFAAARPRARGRTAVWLRPPRRALDPFGAIRLPTGIFATGRSP